MSKKDGGLRGLFRRKLRQVHWTTVETGLAERGVPDLHGTWRRRSFWVECKRAKGWEVSLRPAQVAWLRRNARAGGIACVAVRKGEILWLLRGENVGALRQGGLRALPAGALLGCWQGGPAGWPWPRVLRLVAGQGGRAMPLKRARVRPAGRGHPA